MRDEHRWLRRLTVLGAGLLLLLLGTTAPASAHAALRGTDPADGSVLKSAPREVTLAFTESVGLLTDSLRVYDPENHRVRTSEADHAAGRSDTVRVSLPAGLGTGTYTVAWRVVSADSHPVSGALTFSVGKRTATATSVLADRAENPATTSLYNIARYIAYLAVALLLGPAAFVAYCRPPRPAHLRTPVAAAWGALFASTMVLFLLRTPYEEGTAPTTAFALSSLTRTASTRPGELLLTRLALLLLAGACALALRRWRRRIPRRAALATAAALSVALALTWAASEHASAGLQVPPAITSATLHLLAMAAWLGGLTALALTLRRASPEPAAPLVQAVTRFSRLAFASVTVLVATGVYQSWRGLGSWQALTDTTYGRLLLAKLAAVALLLAAASRSRRWTTRLAARPAAREQARVPQPAGGPPLPPGPDPAPAPAPAPAPHPHSLRRWVLTEMAVGTLVLVLTTLLTNTLPGRAAAEAAESAPAPDGIRAASVTTVPFDVGTPGGHGKVQITLDPGRVGTNSVQAVVYGPDGGLSAVPELRITFTLPAQRIGPLDTKVTDRGGYWAADAFNLPIPGTWTMKVTVRVSEVDQVTVSKAVRVVR
ncbi:copper resistance CopC/CopD family protein [Streptomyces sp. BK340]|uniref:copper resistance CopC/CopD family protein n=1 Tax=Streptomyces sp. BK340 TaxID=2572903 RepID=UPI0011ACA9B0|nr:copper resistance protein CopC [Streptomyces sp. BK340]TVZ93948.1 copper transport protein [Streptomyces sp. BK340]